MHLGYLLVIFSIAVFLLGCAVFGIAESALHEIEAFVLFAASANLLAGGTIILAIQKATRLILNALHIQGLPSN